MDDDCCRGCYPKPSYIQSNGMLLVLSGTNYDSILWHACAPTPIHRHHAAHVDAFLHAVFSVFLLLALCPTFLCFAILITRAAVQASTPWFRRNSVKQRNIVKQRNFEENKIRGCAAPPVNATISDPGNQSRHLMASKQVSKRVREEGMSYCWRTRPGRKRTCLRRRLTK